MNIQTEIRVNEPIENIPKFMTAIGIVSIENGCCKDRSVAITKNWIGPEKRWNYSCQCACGMWCTSGHRTAGAALSEYEEMIKKSKKQKEEDKNANNRLD